MPINAFGGGVGSGKTYGVMEHVVLPAIAKGRFIITNIEGLNIEAIYEYVARNFSKGKIICIGHIRQCDRNAPDEEEFFPGEYALDKAMPVPNPDTPKVVGGDLVVIDEATRYWNGDTKVKTQHAYFFREHRHFANEMGHTCDMVVIDPDLTILARALKGKIEMSSITHKPKEIGLNRYVVNLFRGVRLTRKPTSMLGPYKFKKEIYSLYKSYSHENAKEQPIDKRQNIFANPKIWIYAIALLVMLVGCISGLFWYYKSQVKKFTHEKEKPSSTDKQMATTIDNQPLPAKARQETGSSKSERLRIAGEVVLSGQHWILIADSNGSFRLENPAAFTGKGLTMVGDVEGQRVTTWTGLAVKQNSIAGEMK